jgi:hypothetical protein
MGLLDYYDRDGKKISRYEFNRLLGDMEYKRVAETQIGPYWVSTVWLGLDHQFGQGPPLLFETMVFAVDRDDPGLETLGPDLDCQRYSTEAEALAGHEDMCTLIRATIQEVIPDVAEESGQGEGTAD